MNSRVRKATWSAFVMLIPLLLVAVATPEENQSDKTYVIGPGDILDIQVWDHEDLHRKVEVSQQGAFTFPLIGNAEASGLSVSGIEKLIAARLANGYLVAPQVTVSVLEYRSHRVFLFGEVKKPGTYAVKGRLHLVELLSQAGGLTEKAGTKVIVVRPLSSRPAGAVPLEDAKEAEVKKVDLDQVTAGTTNDHAFVISGDSVYVLEAPQIYVAGYVEKPGDFKWERGLTVRQAIILAGGSNEWGSDKRAKVVRLVNDLEKEFEVKLEDIVMPGDIIKVPAVGFFEAKDTPMRKGTSFPQPVLKPWGVRGKW